MQQHWQMLHVRQRATLLISCSFPPQVCMNHLCTDNVLPQYSSCKPVHMYLAGYIQACTKDVSEGLDVGGGVWYQVLSPAAADCTGGSCACRHQRVRSGEWDIPSCSRGSSRAAAQQQRASGQPVAFQFLVRLRLNHRSVGTSSKG